MTTKQKLQIEQSENREKLNGLLGKETLDDKERGELDELSKRLQEIEPELRAAIVAEAEEESRAAGLFGNGNGDGEAGERGRLLRETRLSDYMVAASGGNGIEGRARELNAAFEIPNVGPSGGVLIPWAMLERRAYTTTANNDGGFSSVRSCNVFSVPVLWIKWAFRSTPFLLAVPSGLWSRRRRARSENRRSGCVRRGGSHVRDGHPEAEALTPSTNSRMN